jgi:hypothetical protein
MQGNTNMSGNKLVQMKSTGLAHRRSAHICDAALDLKPHSVAYPASVRHCPGATALWFQYSFRCHVFIELISSSLPTASLSFSKWDKARGIWLLSLSTVFWPKLCFVVSEKIGLIQLQTICLITKLFCKIYIFLKKFKIRFKKEKNHC